MLDRELTYRMPFERLRRLGRSANRKAFRTTWVAVWGLLAFYFGMIALFIIFADDINRLEREAGTPWWSWFAALIAAFVAAFFALRRRWQRQMQSRVDFDSAVTFTQEPSGLRFATPQIEYLVKWDGISQMLMEPDGVVFSHGGLFFMIPNSAFADPGERDALIQDVFGRLNDAARARSEPLVRPFLAAAFSTTRT